VLAPKLRQKFRKAQFVDIDGIRVDTNNDMIVIRASQNGPYLTIKFESSSKNRFNEIKRYLSNLLHLQPEINFDTGVNVESLD
jgi:phosphomannomutase